MVCDYGLGYGVSGENVFVGFVVGEVFFDVFFGFEIEVLNECFWC